MARYPASFNGLRRGLFPLGAGRVTGPREGQCQISEPEGRRKRPRTASGTSA
jgi:hypothetical protein